MTAIEHYLALRPHWVPASELERLFEVDERELRATHGNPGLCSAFTISSNLGYKHVRHTSEEERKAFQVRLRSAGRAQIDRADQLEDAWNQHQQISAEEITARVSFDEAGQGQLLT